MTLFEDSHHFSTTLAVFFMTLLKDSHHFSNLWSHSLKTANTSAVFGDTLAKKPSLQQNFSSLWWHSWKTAITSAVFDDNALMTLFQDSHHFSSLWRQCFQQSLVTKLFSKEPFAAAFGNYFTSSDPHHDILNNHVDITLAMYFSQKHLTQQMRWVHPMCLSNNMNWQLVMLIHLDALTTSRRNARSAKEQSDASALKAPLTPSSATVRWCQKYNKKCLRPHCSHEIQRASTASASSR